jgi:competence protein ComEC
MTMATAAGWGTPAWGRRWQRALAARIAAEGDRRHLWFPVAFGAGIALYFALTTEPPLWPAIVAVFSGAALAFALRRHTAGREAAVAFALAAAGFGLAREATLERAAPILERRFGPAEIVGRVVDVDLLDRGWRLVLAPEGLPGLTPAERPYLVRLRVPASSDLLLPGERVRLKALIYPPPGQIVPGGRDLQRELYFARIGGVGYSLGPARRIVDPNAEMTEGGWRLFVERLRTEMSRRITAVLPGAIGGIASTLITGKRGAIPEKDKQAFRDSGLAHLLAISGLHLGLVGGFVFVALRGVLALIPWVALRYPIKKIAAAAALAVLVCYLFISGAAVPTQRAFVMNGIVFAAVLIDRLRISMRICAIAAAFVLAIDPASLVGVSFQMSFGAVVALIAAYETWGDRLARLFHRPTFPGQLLGYCGAVVATTIVATMGTEPFSIYHFHHLAFYSPLANVLAVPISAMWTLPWGLCASLLMPLGLERLALAPMGWGIEMTLWVAQGVARLPGNVWATPRMPLAGLLLVIFGGLWLCLWQGPWRRWGGLAIAAGLASTLLTRPPDLVIADIGRFIAARAPSGNYTLLADGGGRIARAILAEETGENGAPWSADMNAAESGLACARDLCLYEARGRRVAIVTGEAALPLDCGRYDAVLAQVLTGWRCRSAIPVVDRIDSWRLGAVALWLDPDGVVVESANKSRGDRPWVPRPRPRHRPAADEN